MRVGAVVSLVVGSTATLPGIHSTIDHREVLHEDISTLLRL